MLQFDLGAESEALFREDGWITKGHSAKTLVKHHDFRIVLITMKKGSRIAEHRTAGALSLHPLRGSIQLHVGDQTVAVPTGGLLALDRGLSYDVEALEDCAFVLSVENVS